MVEMTEFRRRMSEDVKASPLSIKVEPIGELKRKPQNEPPKISKFKRYAEVFVAETFATTFLMTLGCMSCAGDTNTKALTDFFSVLMFAFTVSTMICTFGHISAAHMNPAVTVAFYVMGNTPLDEVPVYFVAEMLGATTGMSILKTVSPANCFGSDHCVTKLAEGVGVVEGLAIEFLITFILVCMINGLCDPRNAKLQDSASLKFSAAIIGISLAASKYTGASMNPARSFGPAFITNNWASHWIYWVGPISAAITAPLFYRFFKPKDI